ncbi:MAG: hypothetical protein QM612_09705 [Thermomonas sp.]|uniref:hypothetical protein n=1 Tax=Thermomonas sp. TaxID=1971895 RepID=UPI0039E3B923
MKKFTLLVMAALAVAGCQQEAQAPSEAKAQPEAEPLKQVGKPASRANVEAPISDANWERELAWVDEGAMVDGRTSISTARSVEEAQWLQRQGFLTRSKIDYLKSLGPAEVERLARAGNRDAILFLGDQLIKDGRGDLVVRALNHLIDKEASIPALHLRARYKTSKVVEVPSELPTDSWQWRDAAFESSRSKIDVASDYFAAYLLGDYRGSQIGTKMFSYEGSGAVPPAVYTEAARKVARMAQSGHPIKLDPRPIPEEANGVQDF